jgi:radical SAM protein with 4Fe4S-binding SPASM domain
MTGAARSEHPGALGGPAVARRLRFDLGSRPFLVLFELTRACELACRHCRADAMLGADPDELSTDEVLRVLDDLASLGAPRPIVVLTGGDPLRRGDLDDIVRHGARSGLAIAVSPAGTLRASRSRLAALRRAGASAVSFSIDGASPDVHDAFRRVDGSFDWTVAACRAAASVGLRLQINTTVSAETVAGLPDVLRLVAELGASLWSVFFLVPTGRGTSLRALSAAETEDVLAFLAEAASVFPLKTTEAPAYRRVLLGRRGGAPWPPATAGPLYADLHRRLELLAPSLARVPPPVAVPSPGPVAVAHDGGRRPAGSSGGTRRAPLAVGDGRGVVFVSHRGEVSPSGFLPLVVGNVRERPLTEIYAGSPLLRALRDPSRLGGRCGRCELAEACGGSRAQAYARTGDPLAEDPTCLYDPSPRLRTVDGLAPVATSSMSTA